MSRLGRKEVSKIERDKFTRDYENGMSISCLCLNYNLTQSGVFHRVKKWGLRRSHGINPVEINKADKLIKYLEEKSAINLNVPEVVRSDMKTLGALEGLSVIDFSLNIYKNILVSLKTETDKSISRGEKVNIDAHKFGSKSLPEFIDSVMNVLKMRMNYIKEIPDISEVDDFEKIVMEAINEIKKNVPEFRRSEIPEGIVYKCGGSERVIVDNVDDIIKGDVSDSDDDAAGNNLSVI